MKATDTTRPAALRAQAMRSTLFADVFDRGHSVVLWITGLSMYPELRPGDRVEVMPCRAQDLRPGDLVLLGGDSLIIHRYLFRRGSRIIAKGDHAAAFDPPWPVTAVEGRVAVRIREGRRTKLDRGWSRWRGRCIQLYWAGRHRLTGVRRRLRRSPQKHGARSEGTGG